MLPNVLLLALVPGVLGMEIPNNLKKLYGDLKTKGKCENKLATGFHNSAFEEGDMSYCGDHLEDYGIIYLQGPGKFANMDIDCDGAPGFEDGDTRCEGGKGTTIPKTSVQYIIEGYNVGISDLNTHDHSFAVFGNSRGDKPSSWPVFDPQEYGVSKASVMAIICGDQMFYGLWGDTNGGHGDRASVGEASLSLATACYGQGMSGGSENNSSHDEPDVLYIAFTGKDALPGPEGANWKADSFEEFHQSIVGLGDELVKRIGRDGGFDPPKPPSSTCSWPGHCLGAQCAKHQDCADDLMCKNKECSEK